MTERSIFSGSTPRVVIRAEGDVVVKGYDSDQVLAETSGSRGLKLKRKKDAIEVEFGDNGQVLVPAGSQVLVYAGKSAEVQAIAGSVSTVAGQDICIRESNVLVQASAGGKMEIDCRAVAAQELKLSAGWHLRCWLRDLKDVKYLIDDVGGKWQAMVGGGHTLVWLKAGGDVTLVSAEPAAYQPEDGPHGKIVPPE